MSSDRERAAALLKFHAMEKPDLGQLPVELHPRAGGGRGKVFTVQGDV